VISQLRFNTINNPEAFVGMQEVLQSQLFDVVNGLNDDRARAEPEWAYIGVGRDDGKEQGEYSPILYRPSIWKLENFTTLWLSETPNVPGSKGWDANNVRILTIGNFEHRKTRTKVVAMNTHFDHVGTVARENSARLISEQVEIQQRQRGNPSVLLTGDFNSETGQEAYQYFSRAESPVVDARDSVPEADQYGNRLGTFSGFDGSAERFLDYIFLNKRGSWNVKTFATLGTIYDEGIYYSDHYPVVVDAELGRRGR
jgi:endonuclease/exonuclease/phosphatase family metal-dependent hydrolase